LQCMNVTRVDSGLESDTVAVEDSTWQTIVECGGVDEQQRRKGSTDSGVEGDDEVFTAIEE